MASEYRWQSCTDPHLITTADVTWTSDGLTATGSQASDTYEAAWTLDASHGWVTRHLRVDVHGPTWHRSLHLERSPTGTWSSRQTSTGTPPAGMPGPGLQASTQLADALDCDLGLCPLTNTMPIRRLGLLEAATPETHLVMAWVDMPSLRVSRSAQCYASTPDGTVIYASGTPLARYRLTVDKDGIVTDYPQLAHLARPWDPHP